MQPSALLPAAGAACVRSAMLRATPCAGGSPRRRRGVVLLFVGQCQFAGKVVPRLGVGARSLFWAVPAQAPEAVCLPTTSVSSAAPGSLRSPFRGAPEPAVLPHNAADRLRGHAPLAALVPRPWSLGDSLPARAIPPHRILPATRLPATKANQGTHALAAVRMGTEYPARGTVKGVNIYNFGQRLRRCGSSGQVSGQGFFCYLLRDLFLL